MRYDSYYSKMQRFARFMRKIFRHIVPISIVLGVVVVATAATLISVGSFKGEVDFPDSVTYGETPKSSTEAFLSDVYYEYKTKGGSEWTTVMPRDPGEYVVRAVSSNVFGGKKYSDEKAFVLNPKSIEVKVVESSVRYGDPLTVSADLVDGDTISCGGFNYETLGEGAFTVSADPQKIVIINKEGKDVTASYNITAIPSDISLEKRPLKITVSDRQKEYDGAILAFDGFEYNENQLAEGDTLIASFDKSISNAGEIINEPTIQIKNLNGKDVTSYYQIESVIGKLTVEKRMITVSINGSSFVYDGRSHYFNTEGEAYIISDEDKAFLESLGHHLRVKTGGWTTVIDVNEDDPVENVLSFEIVDDRGVDVSENYNLFFAMGNAQLTVTKRPLKIDLSDEEKIYDGKAFDRVYTVTEFNDALEAKVKAPVTVFSGTSNTVSFPLEFTGHTLTFVLDGNRTNVRLTDSEKDTYSVTDVKILDGAGMDVTHNYDFEGDTATLAVTPRSIAIQTFDMEKVYDGKPLDRMYRVVENYDPDVSLSDDGKVYAIGDNIVFNLISTGQQLHFTLSGNKTNADDNMAIGESGSYNPTSIRITSGDGADETEISTDNYEIVTNSASLKISRKPITVTAGSDEKLYDGIALECKSYTNDTLADNHIIDVKTTGSFVNCTGDAQGNNVITSVIIKDASGHVVTDNYSITKVPGTVKISQRPIKIEVFSVEKTYDGVAIDRKYQITETDDKYNSVIGEIVTVKGNAGDDISLKLADNHSLRFTLSGNRTNVTLDEYNSATYTPVNVIIYNAAGEEVNGNFIISVNTANLNVSTRKLTVIAPSASKVFDGTKLTRDFSSAELLRLTSALNSKDVNFYFDGVDTDNTDNLYKLTETDLADGITHSFDVIKVEGEELNMTETIIVDSVTGEEKVITKQDNNAIVEIRVKDENGNDVSTNYSIKCVPGSLNITRNRIVIGVKNAFKYYDGTPISCNDVYVEKYVSTDGTEYNGIASTHKVVDVIVGVRNSTTGEVDKLSGVGTAESYIKSYRIVDTGRTDKNGEYIDVTDDYFIDDSSKKTGKLVIEKNGFSVKMKSDSKVYDGVALNRTFCIEYKLAKTDGSGNVVYTDMDIGGETYIIPEYNVICTNYITVNDDGTANFELYGKDYEIVFDGENIVDAGSSNWKVKEIKELSEDCYSYAQLFVDKNGESMGDATWAKLGIEKRRITVHAFSGSKIYDKQYLNRYYKIEIEGATGQVLEGFVGEENSVEFTLQDVASQKMLLAFSGSNIIDASTVDWRLESHSVKSGEQVVDSLNSNYDVETKYYNDKNVEIASGKATLTVSKRRISVTVLDESAIYSGSALKGGRFKLSVENDNGVMQDEVVYYVDGNGSCVVSVGYGEELKISLSGEVVNATAGSPGWSVADATVENGRNIDNYAVAYTAGKLEIAQRRVVIKMYGAEKIYDGTYLGRKFEVDVFGASNYVLKSWSGYVDPENSGNNTVELAMPAEISNQRLKLVFTGANAKNVYESDRFDIDRSAGEVDGGEINIANYSFTYEYYDAEGKSASSAEITVTPRPVLVKMYGAEKIYDGKYLGRRYSIEVFGKNDARLKYVEGYVDAENSGNNTVEFIMPEEVSSQKLTLKFTGANAVNVSDQCFDVDKTANSINDGAVSTANYSFTYEYYNAKGAKASSAEIIITQRPVVIKMYGAEKIYDGRAIGRKYDIAVLGAEGVILRAENGFVDPNNDGNNTINFVMPEEVSSQILTLTFTGKNAVNVSDSGSFDIDRAVHKVNGGEISTSNYSFSYEYYSANGEKASSAAISVTKRPIVIRMYSASKIYDGQYLRRAYEIEVYGEEKATLIYLVGYVDPNNDGNNTVILDLPEEVSNQRLEVSFTGKNAIDVADSGSWNFSGYKVNGGAIEKSNFDVSLEYYRSNGDLQPNAGSAELTISKRSLEITVIDATKIYDGKPLVAEKFTLSIANNNGVMQDATTHSVDKQGTCEIYVGFTGERLNVTLSGEITDYSKSVSRASVEAAKCRSLDNYIISLNGGELEVTQRHIKVKMYGASKVYDAKYLGRYFELEILGDKNAVIASTNGYVDPENNGNNAFEYTMLDVSGYMLELTFYGKNAIDVSDSGTWGFADFTVDEGEIPRNNFVIDFESYDSNRNKIGNVNGAQLTVNKRQITVSVLDKTKIYDGTALKGDNFKLSVADNYGAMQNATSHSVDKDGICIVPVGNTGETLEVTLTGAITNVSKSNARASVKIKEGRAIENYLLDVVDGNLEITQRKIVVKMHGASKVYDGQYLGRYFELEILGENDAVIETLNGYVDPENKGNNVIEYVMAGVSNQTLKLTFSGDEIIDRDTGRLWTLSDYIVNNGEIVKSNFNVEKKIVGNAKEEYALLVIEKRRLNIEILENSKVYDAMPLMSEKFKIFESDSKGVMAETSPEYGIVEHNYIDGLPVNYVGEMILNTGHKLTVTFEGYQIDANADSPNYSRIVSISITDESGNYVDPWNYDIDSSFYTSDSYRGKLTVEKREFELITDSQTKIYDGKELIGKVETIEAQKDDRGLLSVHSINIAEKDIVSITNAGSVLNKPIITVVDKLGNDVTKNYTIIGEWGTLTVDKRQIEIEIFDVEKTYDATPLKAETFKVTEYGKDGEILVSDTHQIKYDENGVGTASITLFTTGEKMNLVFMGEKINVIADVSSDVKTCNINGETNNKNYIVNVVKGDLTVNKRSVTVTTHSGEFFYNGTDMTHYFLDQNNFVEGHKVIIESGTVFRNVTSTSIDNKITFYHIEDEEKATIDKNNYQINFVWGKIKVNPMTLVFSTKGSNANKVYDGTALSNNNYSVDVYCGKDFQTTHNNAFSIGDDSFYVSTSMITHVSENGEGNNRIENIYIGGELFAVIDEYGNVSCENSNYIIEIGELGTLEIIPLQVTINTVGSSKTYDGTALTVSRFTVNTLNASVNIRTNSNAEGEVSVIDGETLKAIFSGTQTDAGTSENTIASVTVSNKRVALPGEAVTDAHNRDYEIVEIVNDTLTVDKREIIITPADVSKVYDGKVFFDTLKKYSSEGLVEGHSIVSIDATLTGYTVFACETFAICEVNSFTVKSGNKDVTQNYFVSVSDDAKLTISKRPILITTASDSKTYDGTPLTKTDAFVIEQANGNRGLLSGEDCEVTVIGSITEPGNAENNATVVILANGIDVTASYDVEYNKGILEVKKIKINHILTESKEKVDDGTPLIWEKTVDKEGKLLAGHSFLVVFTGKQSGVGSSENTVDRASLMIVDKNGREVTKYYDINNVTWAFGTLTVKLGNNEINNPGLILPEVGEDYQIGLPEGVDSLEDLDKGTLYEILIGESNSTRLYFKQMSFGAYGGNTWLTAEESDIMITIGGKQYSMAYLMGLALEENGYSTNTVKITPVLMKNYIAPYYISRYMGSVMTSDTIVSGNATGSYSLMYYSGISWGGVFNTNHQYSSYETVYANAVKQQYLDIEKSTSEYLISYMKNHGIISANMNVNTLTNSQKLELITKIANYMQTTSNLKYDLDYDRRLDSADDVAIAFLRGDFGAEGVCQHYATAATLMFRALNIPARYTVGYVADATQSSYSITGKDAHAWVEVYIDGIGWRYVEVTGGSPVSGSNGGNGVTGTVDGNKEKLYIAPSYIAKPYDGSELVADSFYARFGNTGFDDLTKYDVIVTYGGSIVDCGVSRSWITDLKIVEKASGDVVYHYSEDIGTDKYYFEFGEGELIVQKTLKVEVGEYTTTYNGQNRIFSSMTGETKDLVCIYAHGDFDADISWYIGIAEDGDFILHDTFTHSGYLKVHLEFEFGLTDAGSISFAELNAMREYCIADFEVTHYDDYYESGDYVYCIGESYDVTRYFTTVFCDNNGDTDSVAYAPLTVNKCAIKIKVTDVSKAYDESYGESPLVSREYTVLEDNGFPDDIILEIQTTGSISSVGSVNNTVSSYRFYKVVSDGLGNEFEIEIDSSNFDFSYVDGYLELTK